MAGNVASGAAGAAAAKVVGKQARATQFGHKWATDDPVPASPHDDGTQEASLPRRPQPHPSDSQFGRKWAEDGDRPYGGAGRRPDGGLDARPPFLSRERSYSQFGRKWATEDEEAAGRRRPRDKTWVRRRATPGKPGGMSAHPDGGGGDDGGDGDGDWFGDRPVPAGRANPAVFLPAGREKPEARPAGGVGGISPPATSECPALICDLKRLERLGVHTGERYRQWGDRLGATKGLEDSYKIGPSPMREWRSPLGMYDDILGGDNP